MFHENSHEELNLLDSLLFCFWLRTLSHSDLPSLPQGVHRPAFERSIRIFVRIPRSIPDLCPVMAVYEFIDDLLRSDLRI